ncbi:hypothetical protein QLX08_002136 [Tetragonisca angustula]|uniref:DNA-directed RNA polymerase n=1 Tax=Tetragonisca angustula TaxID=166442 RepID=A0AAW1ABX7_9HYME
MYKHLATRVAERISPHGVLFIPKQVIVQRSMRLCSFCNFHHGKTSKSIKHQLRTYNTTVNILDHSPIKKKVKRKTKKYAELLAVTNNAASNKRTKVQKLTASNISILVDDSDVSANKLCNNKNSILDQQLNSNYINENCHNLCDTEIYLNIENDVNIANEKGMKDCKKFHDKREDFNTLNINNEIKNNILQKNSSLYSAEETKEKKHQKYNTQLQKKKNLHQIKNKYEAQNYVENLLSYMDVYLFCGLLNRANKILVMYRKKSQKNLKSNESIKLYNMLLGAYASERKIGKVLELYDMIKKDSLTPTSQTYAYIFDALGRETVNNKKNELLKKLNIEMNDYNVSFNDIFNKSYFTTDQEKNILKVIRILMPDFKLSHTTLDINYKCRILKNNLTGNNYESPVEGLLTMEELKHCFKIQLQTELAFEVEIPSIKLCDKNIKTSSEEKIAEIEKYWRNAASAAFERNLKCLKQKECQSHNALMVLYPFLEVLDKNFYIDAMLREIKQLAKGSESFSAPVKLLNIKLGKYIYRRYEIERKKKTGVLNKMISIYSKYLEWYLHPEKMTHLNNMNHRIILQYFEREEANYSVPSNFVCLNWPMDVIVNIGKFLYNIILNDIMLQPEILKGQDLKYSIPAFYTLFRNKETYLSEEIKPHPLVVKLYKTTHLETLTFDTLFFPSYGPPNPWISIYSGGYLITKTDFMRVGGDSNSLCHLKITDSEQLFPIFDSLNQLSSIPWKINTAILDIVIKIFQDGGCAELKVPQSISVLSPPNPISKNATIEEKQRAAIAKAQYIQKKADMYSLWCDTLYKLSIANHYRNKIFWLPHNLDFRGRVYPVPPYLNHLSSDLGRSLLLFAKGKPLGPNGLDWLKLHVINLTNFKKGNSVKERLKYANENMDNIIDSATKPLTGKMWWKQSEEPWQTLAACMEIANALKAPNIEEYISTFPVHQDGSCNGLQHYAALGEDQIGAESVNLYPFDIPKDVYSEVVSVVEAQRQIDAKNNIIIAQMLEGFIKRKVIKQTVMTTVYGVTKYGAKLQIAKQLRDIENFPKEYVWQASIYLTENTFHSLRKMFKSAREIQDWFTQCAQIISSTFYQNVEWITPLGLPVVQPYTKQKFPKKRVKGNERPDTMKQRNAFAPNFIHSLDSTHMMLTGLNCYRNNVTFVSVHDCFWTHPCTVDVMNKICREQFVALHSEPILEDLAQFFVTRYLSANKIQEYDAKFNLGEVHNCFINVPSKGTFDINKVLSSVYFFS